MLNTRDEHGTGTVPIPYRISGTDFFPSINSGTGTVPNGIRIPVPVPVSVPVPGNRVFPVFIREFPDLVPVPYRISGPDFFFTLFRSPGTVPYIGNDTVSVRYRYGSGSVPGFGSKCSSLVLNFFVHSINPISWYRYRNVSVPVSESRSVRYRYHYLCSGKNRYH